MSEQPIPNSSPDGTEPALAQETPVRAPMHKITPAKTHSTGKWATNVQGKRVRLDPGAGVDTPGLIRQQSHPLAEAITVADTNTDADDSLAPTSPAPAQEEQTSQIRSLSQPEQASDDGTGVPSSTSSKLFDFSPVPPEKVGRMLPPMTLPSKDSDHQSSSSSPSKPNLTLEELGKNNFGAGTPHEIPSHDRGDTHDIIVDSHSVSNGAPARESISAHVWSGIEFSEMLPEDLTGERPAVEALEPAEANAAALKNEQTSQRPEEKEASKLSSIAPTNPPAAQILSEQSVDDSITAATQLNDIYVPEQEMLDAEFLMGVDDVMQDPAMFDPLPAHESTVAPVTTPAKPSQSLSTTPARQSTGQANSLLASTSKTPNTPQHLISHTEQSVRQSNVRISKDMPTDAIVAADANQSVVFQTPTRGFQAATPSQLGSSTRKLVPREEYSFREELLDDVPVYDDSVAEELEKLHAEQLHAEQTRGRRRGRPPGSTQRSRKSTNGNNVANTPVSGDASQKPSVTGSARKRGAQAKGTPAASQTPSKRGTKRSRDADDDEENQAPGDGEAEESRPAKKTRGRQSTNTPKRGSGDTDRTDEIAEEEATPADPPKRGRTRGRPLKAQTSEAPKRATRGRNAVRNSPEPAASGTRRSTRGKTPVDEDVSDSATTAAPATKGRPKRGSKSATAATSEPSPSAPAPSQSNSTKGRAKRATQKASARGARASKSPTPESADDPASADEEDVESERETKPLDTIAEESTSTASQAQSDGARATRRGRSANAATVAVVVPTGKRSLRSR
ncbi:hypothetical protein PYCC9005_000822 [Savitreella phatthalungensis]